MNDTDFKALYESVQIILGNGEPSPGLGNELDLFIDQTDRRFYRKCNGVWTANASFILGPLFLTLTPPANPNPDTYMVPVYYNGEIFWKEARICRTEAEEA